MKPGYKTSEFWLSMAPWILAAIVLIGLVAGTVDTDTGIILMGLLGVGGGVSNYGYAKGRSLVKANENDS